MREVEFSTRESTQQATATETVTITITGTNDSPVVVVGGNTDTVVEAGNLDNGAVVAGDPSASGTLTSTITYPRHAGSFNEAGANSPGERVPATAQAAANKALQ